MGSVFSNLMNGESVVHRTKLSHIIFLKPAIIALIGFIPLYFYWPLAAAPCFLFAFFVMLPSFIKYLTSDFVVTNKRVIVKEGFIRRKSVDTLLHKIQGIEVDQGIIGRLMGYGDITISGTGGTVETFKTISQPFEFRGHVQEQTDIDYSNRKV